MGRLSTHVLDTSRGEPARGVLIDLFVFRNDGRVQLATARTNDDGRTDKPLLSGEALETGVYELKFYVAEYFQSIGAELDNPPFLGEVVIRFGVAQPDANYHVPLLITPYSYSTYRGS